MFSKTPPVGLLVANIGRNLGATTTAMAAADWAAFNEEVAAAFIGHGYEVVAHNYGRGVYEGVEEDNATIYAIGVDAPSVALTALAYTLSHVAKRYGQESVALGVGVSYLVAPAAPLAVTS